MCTVAKKRLVVTTSDSMYRDGALDDTRSDQVVTTNAVVNAQKRRQTTQLTMAMRMYIYSV